MDIYENLKNEFKKVVDDNNLNRKKVKIKTKNLSAKDAIGVTKRKDFPILSGKEIMLEARVENGVGQAFTSTPCEFVGNLDEILELDLENPYNKSIFIASLNAVFNHLGLCFNTIHCKNDEPEICGEKFLQYLKTNYPKDKILIIGYQPSIIDHLKDDFSIRVLDLNKDIVGHIKYNVLIEHGYKNYEDAINWADIILCTGSTISNGSIIKYINLDNKVYFYGTTIVAASKIFNLERLCFCSH